MNVTEIDETAYSYTELCKKVAMQIEVMCRSKQLAKAGASSVIFGFSHSKIRAGCLPRDMGYHEELA